MSTSTPHKISIGTIAAAMTAGAAWALVKFAEMPAEFAAPMGAGIGHILSFGVARLIPDAWESD